MGGQTCIGCGKGILINSKTVIEAAGYAREPHSQRLGIWISSQSEPVAKRLIPKVHRYVNTGRCLIRLAPLIHTYLLTFSLITGSGSIAANVFYMMRLNITLGLPTLPMSQCRGQDVHYDLAKSRYQTGTVKVKEVKTQRIVLE